MYVQYTFEAHVVGMQHLHRQNNTTYNVYTYTCTYSYKVFKQINILLLAIPSGMKIIFQPSCFHSLTSIPGFVIKKKKKNISTREKQRNTDDNNK